MDNTNTTTSVFDVPVNYVLGRCTFGDLDDDEEPTTPTLSVLNVSYMVKERVGPWWKGACLRRIRHKIVLRDVCMHMQGGQLTAILGSSGRVTQPAYNLGPLSTRQRNAIEMAFLWRAESGPLLYAYLVYKFTSLLYLFSGLQ